MVLNNRDDECKFLYSSEVGDVELMLIVTKTETGVTVRRQTRINSGAISPELVTLSRELNKQTRIITSFDKKRENTRNKMCFHCHRIAENMLFCSCKVAYCNSTCQSADWKKHKKLFH